MQWLPDCARHLQCLNIKASAVCLAAENKAVVAAALLASLAGGPTLFLPYAFSANALAQMQQATGFIHRCFGCQQRISSRGTGDLSAVGRIGGNFS